MAALCFFCGCAKTVPNNPLGCGCHRVLSEQAELAKPENCTKPFLTSSGSTEDDDFPDDTGPVSLGKGGAHLDWSYTPKTVELNDGDARCFITTAKPTQGKRLHPHHLVREFRIEPSIMAKNANHINQEFLANPMRQEVRVCEEDVRKQADKLEVSSDCSISSVKPDKKKNFDDQNPLLSGSGGHSNDSWKQFPGQARTHSGKGWNTADKSRPETVPGRIIASKTICSQVSQKSSSNKRSLSLPALGSSSTSDRFGAPEPQRSSKKSLGFKVAYALGATGRLLRTWN